jgi:type VI protein secretion system component VasK
MRQWGETEGDVRGAPRRPWVWARLTGTILTLVGMAGVGLLTWAVTGGAPLRDARLALLALLIYVALCTLIVRGDQARKAQGRATRTEDEERRQRLRRRPYSVVDEAEAVLTHAQGRRETR